MNKGDFIVWLMGLSSIIVIVFCVLVFEISKKAVLMGFNSWTKNIIKKCKEEFIK